MMQLLIGLFLALILLGGYLCQTITSQSSFSSTASNSLAAPETASSSLSEAGEWVMEGHNPGRDRATGAHISPPLNLAQELRIGEETLVGSPVIVAGDLLLAEGNHHLYALTPEGKERWSVELPGSFLSPAVAGEAVFVRAETGEKGYLMAFRLDSGEKLWQFKLPQVGSSYGDMGGHVTSPVVVDGLVLVGGGQFFYAVKAETGQGAWSFPTYDPVSSSAAVAGETVFFTDFGQLYAVDLKTGAERWQFAPGDGSIARLFAPVVNGEQLITSSGATVYALDVQSGQRLWQQEFPSGNLIPAGASGEQVYVKTTQQLYALDRASGTELWSFEAANFVSLPAITEDYLYVVTRAGGQAQLRALERSNGQGIWQVEEKRLSNTAPIIANGQIYVQTTDGRVLVYETEAF